MALATTCPQCKTSFKVVPDQLKLRRGLVRCGVCQHVFSGIDHLRYVDDAARAAQRAARERAAAGGAPVPDGAGAARDPAGVDAPPAATSADVPPPAGTTRVAPTDDARAASGDGPGTPRHGDATPPRAHDRDARPAPPADTPVAGAAPANAEGAAAARAAASTPVATPQGPTREAMSSDSSDPPASSAPDAPRAADLPPDRPAPGANAPAALPADPWAAAAGIAHERSLRDDAGDPLRPPSGTADGASPDATPDARAARAVPDAAPLASGPRSAPSRPALPAPDAPRVPLDDLLARPAAAWPPAAGPQTILAADDDLKTAFFLTDSSFGPLPGETSDVMPPTSIHRPGAHAEAVTRIHGEAPPAPAGTPDAPPSADATRGPLPALPGLPLRPERGTADEPVEASPAFVPMPPPPFEPAPRRVEAPPPEPAIDYFQGSRRRSRGLGLALSPAAWAAAIGLALLLGLQAVVGWRDAIAARVPMVAPALAGLLGPFGLEPRPPRELDALTIEGFELQASGTPNVLTLSAVLRNRSAHVVGYPAMELTLTDSGGALIVRKVIPAELYVGDPSTIEAGLAARTERPLRLALQHDGLQPTGFAVALFYP